MRKLIIALGLPLLSFSHPLLNTNVEERVPYEVLEAGPASENTSISIRPYSLIKFYRYTEDKERIKKYLNALSTPRFFLKPVNSITFNFFYTSEDSFTLENASGTVLSKGPNAYTFLDGYLSLGRRFVFYYQMRYRVNKEVNEADLFRVYGKLKIWKLSLEAGKDTVHLGPGEYALLLSSNAEPFPMVKVQTEEPLNFFGKWDLLFMRGWLKEKRRDRDNPSILALRVVWKPWKFLEIGGTRTAMYEGEGRPTLELIEYPKLIIGTEENIPWSKFDGDGYGAYDITLYLPLQKLWRSVRVFKIYYQESGTDILAWWQKEDEGKFDLPFGFSFLNRGYVAGMFLSLKNDIFRLEFNKVGNRWYLHHVYPIDGYTYKGLSLGHPYGPNLAHIFFKHRHFFSDTFSIEYRFGYLKQPLEKSSKSMNRYYLLTSAERRFKRIILSGFLRLDHAQNYDRNPSPVRFDISDKGKNFITLGTTLSWRF